MTAVSVRDDPDHGARQMSHEKAKAAGQAQCVGRSGIRDAEGLVCATGRRDAQFVRLLAVLAKDGGDSRPRSRPDPEEVVEQLKCI